MGKDSIVFRGVDPVSDFDDLRRGDVEKSADVLSISGENTSRRRAGIALRVVGVVKDSGFTPILGVGDEAYGACEKTDAGDATDDDAAGVDVGIGTDSEIFADIEVDSVFVEDQEVGSRASRTPLVNDRLIVPDAGEFPTDDAGGKEVGENERRGAVGRGADTGGNQPLADFQLVVLQAEFSKLIFESGDSDVRIGRG
jgi:hypothetical protein